MCCGICRKPLIAIHFRHNITLPDGAAPSRAIPTLTPNPPLLAARVSLIVSARRRPEADRSDPEALPRIRVPRKRWAWRAAGRSSTMRHSIITTCTLQRFGRSLRHRHSITVGSPTLLSGGGDRGFVETNGPARIESQDYLDIIARLPSLSDDVAAQSLPHDRDILRPLRDMRRAQPLALTGCCSAPFRCYAWWYLRGIDNG